MDTKVERIYTKNLTGVLKMRSPKKYTLEFRKEAVKLVTNHGYSQAEAGRNLGVDAKNISRWVKEYSSEKGQKEQPTAEQQELKRLNKEIVQLKLEREILKKATAFFAKELA